MYITDSSIQDLVVGDINLVKFSLLQRTPDYIQTTADQASSDQVLVVKYYDDAAGSNLLDTQEIDKTQFVAIITLD